MGIGSSPRGAPLVYTVTQFELNQPSSVFDNTFMNQVKFKLCQIFQLYDPEQTKQLDISFVALTTPSIRMSHRGKRTDSNH